MEDYNIGFSKGYRDGKLETGRYSNDFPKNSDMYEGYDAGFNIGMFHTDMEDS